MFDDLKLWQWALIVVALIAFGSIFVYGIVMVLLHLYAVIYEMMNAANAPAP